MGRLVAALLPAWAAFLGGPLAAGEPPAGASKTEGCLQTRGWDTLPDPGRLCHHLSDPGDVARCEARGHRMHPTEAPWPSLLAEARQYLLLCGHEYVIEVQADQVSCDFECPPLVPGTRYNAFRVRTALVEQEGEMAGEYFRGNVHLLVRRGAGWHDLWLEGHPVWSEYETR